MRFDLLRVTVAGYADEDLQAGMERSMSRISAESNVVGSWRWTEGFAVGGCRQEVEESRPRAPQPSVRQVIPRFALQLSPFVLRLVRLGWGYM